jgi:hypothetical protein
MESKKRFRRPPAPGRLFGGGSGLLLAGAALFLAPPAVAQQAGVGTPFLRLLDRHVSSEAETALTVCTDVSEEGDDRFAATPVSGPEDPGALSQRLREALPADLIDLRGSSGIPQPTAPSINAQDARPPKHFLTAAGEVILLEVGPWTFNRYVTKEGFAYISFETIKNNFKTGFKYDRDDFNTNQSAHPYHGGLFFTAARSNGYDFWESGAFALGGSLLWECCMENTPPSINDLVNTTLGGMTRGEISFRLSRMIRDNTATGSERLWRELGATILDPMGTLTRLLHGDLTREAPNPDDRFPSRFSLAGDIGYRHVAGGSAHRNQGILSFSGFYGDPFAGEIRHPFDSFWVGVDLNQPGGALISRIEERGILKGWELTDASDSARHIVGFSQEYEYFNNKSQVFGAQLFSAGILSQYRFGSGLQGFTDVGALVIPLAGIQTTDFENPQTGRNYDYASGGGVRVAGRLFRGGREILAAGYGVLWAHTDNGSSDTNTLQFLRASARVPLLGPVGVGGGYSWYSRKTTYTGFFEARKTQSEWRVFVDWAFSHRWGGS